MNRTAHSEMPHPPTSDAISAFAMDEATFRATAARITDLAATYLEQLPAGAVYRALPEQERMLIQQMPLPEEGISAPHILDFFEAHIQPWGRPQNHPLFAAFVDPGATPISMHAASLAAAFNTSGTGGHYAMAYVEETCVRWLAELVGFPTQGSDGVFLHGGSDANRHGIEVARFWGARKYGWNVRAEGLTGHPRLVMYVSPERHSCIDKASFTLGLGAPTEVPADRDFRMSVSALREAIGRDRKAGRLPFLVVASAGTVRTGAVDPLDELADLCAEEGLWLHVDGAFGGFGALDPRLAALYKGTERANSLVLDPHKWMAVAIGCSCILINSANLSQSDSLLADTYKLVHSYLQFPPANTFAAGPWFSHRSAAQTRDTAPALKTLFTLCYVGRSGFRAQVQRHIDLAAYMRDLIDASSDLELVASGSLPAVCFRYVPQGLRGREEELNRLNQLLMNRLQAEGRVFLAGVEISGYQEQEADRGEEDQLQPAVSVGSRFALRSCAMHYGLHETHVEAIVAEVRRVGAMCLNEQPAWY